MSIQKTALFFAMSAALTLGGCGLFGSSNPAIGKWKVAGVTSNIHYGFGAGRDMASSMTSQIKGKVYTFTSSKMKVGSTIVAVEKYKQHKNVVDAYIKHGTVTSIIHLKLSDHDKHLSMTTGSITIDMDKVA
jgi:hypothetical protein